MSLNQLLLDEQKSYLDIRVNDLTIDGQLNVTSESDYIVPLTNINYTGARTGNFDYEASRIGNMVTIKIKDFSSSTAPVSAIITSDVIDANIIPATGDSGAIPASMLDNSTPVLGLVQIQNDGRIRFYVGLDEASGNFNVAGNAGLNTHISFSYLLS